MNKKPIYILLVAVLIFALSVILYHKIYVSNHEIPENQTTFVQEQEISNEQKKTESDILEIPLESVEGITQQEAEKLCYSVLGERDENTGFLFSFGTSAAVEKNKKQYYIVRASWLVDNSHFSYIGDFFVSADGKKIYDGLALPDEYIMQNIIWSE